jgi:hypothetical protein
VNIMPTSQLIADRFYTLWHSLLFFANERQRLVPASRVRDVAAITQLPIAEVAKIRKAIWDNDHLREDFIEQNPADLSGADLAIVASWHHRRAGKFFVFRHLKRHSIFIDDRTPVQVYAVGGLYSPMADVVGPYLPVLAEAVLLPFEDQIIYDGVLVPYNITFGSGIRGNLTDIYRDAKERSAIITSLPPHARTLSHADQLATAQSTNAKVLTEFRTHLYRAGLSPKVVERDVASLEAFAACELMARPEPHSLRETYSVEVEEYFSERDMSFATTAERRQTITGFKRFFKFLAETGRIDYAEAEMILRWLKTLD